MFVICLSFLGLTGSTLSWGTNIPCKRGPGGQGQGGGGARGAQGNPGHQGGRPQGTRPEGNPQGGGGAGEGRGEGGGGPEGGGTRAQSLGDYPSAVADEMGAQWRRGPCSSLRRRGQGSGGRA